MEIIQKSTRKRNTRGWNTRGGNMVITAWANTKHARNMGNCQNTDSRFDTIWSSMDHQKKLRKTAIFPDALFYVFPRFTDVFLRQLRILEMTNVHQCGKVDFPFLCLCFLNDILFFALHFTHLPSRNFLELSTILYPLLLSQPEISSLGGIRINLCTKL